MNLLVMKRAMLAGIATLLMSEIGLPVSMQYFEADEVGHFKEMLAKGEVTREEQVRGLVAVARGYRDRAEADLAVGKKENPWPDNPSAMCGSVLGNLPIDDKNLLPFFEEMSWSTVEHIRNQAIRNISLPPGRWTHSRSLTGSRRILFIQDGTGTTLITP